MGHWDNEMMDEDIEFHVLSFILMFPLIKLAVICLFSVLYILTYSQKQLDVETKVVNNRSEDYLLCVNGASPAIVLCNTCYYIDLCKSPSQASV